MDEEPLQVTLGCPDGLRIGEVFAALAAAGYRVDHQDAGSRVWVLADERRGRGPKSSQISAAKVLTAGSGVGILST